MERTATLSEDGRYRYRLSRIWSAEPPVTFVLLNPSTADADADDPTIRRCIGFARRWGCGGVIVVNLYGYRTPWPAVLWQARDPVGPDNDDHLRAALAGDGLTVAAWGCQARSDRIARLLSYRPALTALGVTRSGQPRHPLYLPGTAAPAPWME